MDTRGVMTIRSAGMTRREPLTVTYPAWLLQSMLDWFPKELIEKYGDSLRRAMLNGDALELPADKAERIAADLRAMGNTVEKTDLNIS